MGSNSPYKHDEHDILRESEREVACGSDIRSDKREKGGERVREGVNNRGKD